MARGNSILYVAVVALMFGSVMGQGRKALKDIPDVASNTTAPANTTVAANATIPVNATDSNSIVITEAVPYGQAYDNYNPQYDGKAPYGNYEDVKPAYEPKYDAMYQDKPAYGAGYDAKPAYDNQYVAQPAYGQNYDNKVDYGYGNQYDNNMQYGGYAPSYPKTYIPPQYDSYAQKYDSNSYDKPAYVPSQDYGMNKDQYAPSYTPSGYSSKYDSEYNKPYDVDYVATPSYGYQNDKAYNKPVYAPQYGAASMPAYMP